ncbi:phosphorylase family protein [Candidatus Lokiarchaeum ossiferum]|uniref:phosphorylase family protein n=1 Tax=Candidatus Lokiarchaeum ossiferum TaxID=2951803 RepID=UPI00352CD051
MIKNECLLINSTEITIDHRLTIEVFKDSEDYHLTNIFIGYNAILKILEKEDLNFIEFKEIDFREISQLDFNIQQISKLKSRRMRIIKYPLLFICSNRGLIVFKILEDLDFQYLKFLELYNTWDICSMDYGENTFYFVGYSKGIQIFNSKFKKIVNKNYDQIYRLKLFDLNNNGKKELIVGTDTGKISIFKFDLDIPEIVLVYEEEIIPPNTYGKNSINDFTIFRSNDDNAVYILIGANSNKLYIAKWKENPSMLNTLKHNLNLHSDDEIYNIHYLKDFNQDYKFLISTWKIDFGFLNLTPENLKINFSSFNSANVESTILLVTPTLEELVEVEKFLPNKRLDKKKPSISFPHKYDQGFNFINKKGYKYILISPQKAGHSAAKDILNEAILEWDPKYIILLGVCAGNSHLGVKIGDLIIPEKIYSVELAKLRRSEIFPETEQFKPSNYLIHSLNRFFYRQSEENPYKFNQNNSYRKIKIHSDGAIFSSNTLYEDIESNYAVFPKIEKIDRKLYGIEMEAGGVGSSLEKPKNSGREWIDIRCVMDFANETTREESSKDLNKKNASFLVSKFATEFIEWHIQKENKE